MSIYKDGAGVRGCGRVCSRSLAALREVYALTAYMFALNKIIDDRDVMSFTSGT